MVKLFSLIFVFIMSITLGACNGKHLDGNEGALGTGSRDAQAVKTDEQNILNNGNTEIYNGGLTIMENIRVKMTFNNEDVIVNMYDNPTSRDFLTQLPLTLTLEDYAGTEKISYLPKKLSTENAPSGIHPGIGDFTYYTPWGNLAIF